MKFLLKLGKGKLTFTIAGLTVLWAIVGYFLGLLEPQLAGEYAVAALAVFGVRRSIK